jgi:hypothetical protein
MTTVMSSFSCLSFVAKKAMARVSSLFFFMLSHFFPTCCHQLLLVLLSKEEQFMFMVMVLWKGKKINMVVY